MLATTSADDLVEAKLGLVVAIATGSRLIRRPRHEAQSAVLEFRGLVDAA